MLGGHRSCTNARTAASRCPGGPPRPVLRCATMPATGSPLTGRSYWTGPTTCVASGHARGRRMVAVHSTPPVSEEAALAQALESALAAAQQQQRQQRPSGMKLRQKASCTLRTPHVCAVMLPAPLGLASTCRPTAAGGATAPTRCCCRNGAARAWAAANPYAYETTPISSIRILSGCSIMPHQGADAALAQCLGQLQAGPSPAYGTLHRQQHLPMLDTRPNFTLRCFLFQRHISNLGWGVRPRARWTRAQGIAPGRRNHPRLGHKPPACLWSPVRPLALPGPTQET